MVSRSGGGATPPSVMALFIPNRKLSQSNWRWVEFSYKQETILDTVAWRFIYFFTISQTFQCHGNGLIITTFCQASASRHRPCPRLDCHARAVKFSHRNNHCKLAWAPWWADHKRRWSKEREVGILHRAADQMRKERFAQMRGIRYFAATPSPFYSSWLLSEFPPCDNTPPLAAAVAVVHVQPATSDNVLDIPHCCSAR